MKKEASLVDLYYSRLPGLLPKREDLDESLFPKTPGGLGYYVHLVKKNGQLGKRKKR